METKELIIGRKGNKNISVSLDDINALEEARDILETDIAVIRTQIESARQKCAITGIYEDAEWYNSATTALRFKGLAHQKILRRIGELNRKKREARLNRREIFFVDIAKRRLSPEIFESILCEALEEERNEKKQ